MSPSGAGPTNIRGRARRRRLAGGGVILLAAFAGLLAGRPEPGLRLLLAPAWFLGLLGVLQAHSGL